jgi:hypothetical protein
MRADLLIQLRVESGAIERRSKPSDPRPEHHPRSRLIRSSETRSISRASPRPCRGPPAPSVFRIMRSSVPYGRSLQGDQGEDIGKRSVVHRSPSESCPFI